MANLKCVLSFVLICLIGLAKQDAYSGPIETITEGELTNLNCLHGYQIKVMWGFYGIQGTGCKSHGALEILKQRCDGLRSCGIEATNNNFGDPCHGKKKQLSILYRCHTS